MTATTAAALDALAGSVDLETIDRIEITEVMARVATIVEGRGAALADDRAIALAAHTLAFVRRIRTADPLEGIDLDDFPEIPADTVAEIRLALQSYCDARAAPLADEEVLLFAMHVEAAALGSP